jgi:hypothetical protein
MSAERDDPIGHAHANIRGIDIRKEIKLVDHVLTQQLVVHLLLPLFLAFGDFDRVSTRRAQRL